MENNYDIDMYNRYVSLYKLGIDIIEDGQKYINLYKLLEKELSNNLTFKNVDNNNIAYGSNCLNIKLEFSYKLRTLNINSEWFYSIFNDNIIFYINVIYIYIKHHIPIINIDMLDEFILKKFNYDNERFTRII